MKFDLINTNERRPVEVETRFYEVQDQPQYLGSDYFQTKYRLQSTAVTEFWSNTAQLEQKRAQAEKSVRSYMYKDMIYLVDMILIETQSEDVARLAIELKDKMA